MSYYRTDGLQRGIPRDLGRKFCGLLNRTDGLCPDIPLASFYQVELDNLVVCKNLVSLVNGPKVSVISEEQQNDYFY